MTAVGDLVVGVLALQGDVREHVRALQACGVRARPVCRPTELSDVDALLMVVDSACWSRCAAA